MFTLVGPNDQVSGGQASATDVDLYRSGLGSTTGLWFQVTEGNTPWTSQNRLEFYDAAGALLSGTFGAGGTDSIAQTFRSSAIRCWPAGTY